MEDGVRIVIQWLHVLSGVLWIGGGFYSLMVQLPAMSAMPPAARGPAFAALAPRQIRYVLRVAELTILTGFANAFVSGRAQELAQPFGTRWALMITLGIVLALGLYALVRFVIRPIVERMLILGPQAAGGDAAAAATAGLLRARMVRIGYAQLTIGLVIIFVMVAARFS